MEYEILQMEPEQNRQYMKRMHICMCTCTYLCSYVCVYVPLVYMYVIKGGVSHIGCHIHTYICCYVFRALPHIPREENLSSTFNA